MKVAAFNGSAHRNGNTAYAISVVAQELEKEGIEVETVQVGGEAVHGCTGCGGCARSRNEQCVLKNDPVNEWIQKMKEADGILLASPVYFSGIPGTLKAFLDRAFYVSSSNRNLFRHKVGAAVTAVRRSGGVPVADQLNHYLTYSEMLLPSSDYWNVIYGARAGEAEQDEEGTQILRVLGKNMAWLMKLVEFGRGKVAEPEPEKKKFLNFIR